MQLPRSNAHDQVEAGVEGHRDATERVKYGPATAHLLALDIALIDQFNPEQVGLVRIGEGSMVEQHIVQDDVGAGALRFV